MRDGSDKDCESMRMALEKFSLEVLVRKDFTKSQIKEELENLAKMDHSKNDCFVLVILTHGSPNQLYAKDDKFDVSLLWENFVGSKCESLIGKPKLFFIQACRGTKFDNGAPQPSLPPNATTGADASSFTIPSTGDILVMYATFEGYYAFRNQENGSNFIQTLSKTLLENGSKVELKKLLKYVQRQIALKFISNNPNEPESHQKKQMPCIVSTLTKDFYFTKKDIVELDTAKASV
ncbi:caspase-like [Anopheles nili]|uniref:caspase-like n=1 Tax=Anopheles nili TaxID=185578 RepID=UPI00237B00F2|nr:caspase-like [Anopheles nili]